MSLFDNMGTWLSTGVIEVPRYGCPECGTILDASQETCPECGEESAKIDEQWVPMYEPELH